jgi:putative phosphoribosyl transferase
MAVFADRDDAGRALVAPIRDLLAGAGAELDGRPLLLPLPRGGVPVATPIAAALGLSVVALPVRKIGVPGHAELAMGALAALGPSIEQLRLPDVIAGCRVAPDAVEAAVAAESDTLRGLVRRYHGDRSPPDVAGRVAIVVDDGLATGATMIVAVRLLRRLGAARVMAAVPVGSVSARRRLRAEADDVLCLREPVPFTAVSLAYRRFAAPSDGSVLDDLARYAEA